MMYRFRCVRREKGIRGSRRQRLRRRLETPGVSARTERALDIALAAVLALFAGGWVFAIRDALREGARPGFERVAGAPFARDAAPEAAYLPHAAIRAFTDSDAYGGLSGQVRVIVQEPDGTIELPEDLPEGIQITFREIGADPAPGNVGLPRPDRPGIWNVLVHMRGAVQQVPDLRVLTMVPITERVSGRIGRYRIGEWPFEGGGRPETPAYLPPRGLIEVTPENQDMHVSRHFRLRDFLTKGQDDIWPKYVLLSPRLLDKLELTIDELEAMGHPVRRVGIISGFRTPFYNVAGGDPRGRGALSRHMYGDAMDFFIDNDGDGRMDDLNGDGRVDIRDLEIVRAAAERVERRHPHLLGGIGLYRPTGAHGGFVHIDTRGTRARW
jgi:uncharacterized protein YcbK (DUF882 family)